MSTMRLHVGSYPVVLFFLVMCKSALPVVDTTQENSDKANGPNGHSQCGNASALERCFTKGRVVVSDYFKALKKNKNFDICSRYTEFATCFRKHNEHCGHLRQQNHQVHSWMVVVDQLNLVCIDKTADHVAVLDCFDGEIRGPLSLTCDAYFKFNHQQRTHHECRFLREKIRCQERLISSACGHQAAEFAFNLLKLNHGHQIDKLSCTVNKHDQSIQAFGYSDSCRPGFLEEIQNCSNKHLKKENVAEFHSDNDLIALKSTKKFQSACRAYTKFTDCLKPINASCLHGVQMLLDYESTLRQYMIKMDHVCQPGIVEVYSSNLKCFQHTLANKHLEKCDHHWNNIRPILDNTTAVQFFCQPYHTNTVKLIAEMGQSHLCHRSVYREQCGENASSVIADLMDTALRDPLYLRLGYKPDCQLHGVDDVAPPRTDAVIAPGSDFPTTVKHLPHQKLKTSSPRSRKTFHTSTSVAVSIQNDQQDIPSDSLEHESSDTGRQFGSVKHDPDRSMSSRTTMTTVCSLVTLVGLTFAHAIDV